MDTLHTGLLIAHYRWEQTEGVALSTAEDVGRCPLESRSASFARASTVHVLPVAVDFMWILNIHQPHEIVSCDV